MKERPGVIGLDDLPEKEKEALMRMLGQQEERKKIDRGEFMLICHGAATEHLKNFLQVKKVIENVDALDSNQYRVDFFVDGHGNPSYEAKPKGPAGFGHLRKKK